MFEKRSDKTTSRRISVDDVAGSTAVEHLEEVDKCKIYWQVTVGSYGVCLPKTINVETLGGLTLVEGKASTINNKALAEKIAKKTSGKLLEVTEKFTREIVEVKTECKG